MTSIMHPPMHKNVDGGESSRWKGKEENGMLVATGHLNGNKINPKKTGFKLHIAFFSIVSSVLACVLLW